MADKFRDIFQKTYVVVSMSKWKSAIKKATGKHMFEFTSEDVDWFNHDSDSEWPEGEAKVTVNWYFEFGQRDYGMRDIAYGVNSVEFEDGRILEIKDIYFDAPSHDRDKIGPVELIFSNGNLVDVF
jgi:hypothetical protein